MLSAGGELAVALRERLDRAWVTVLDAGDGDPMGVIASCQPWPWMLVGDIPMVPAAVAELTRHRPVLLRWLGVAPAGLPHRCQDLTRFADLAASVSAALGGAVGDVRLAMGAGVAIGPDVHVNAELEALLGESPRPLDMPRSRFRIAEALLDRCAPGVRVTSRPGGVTLEVA